MDNPTKEGCYTTIFKDGSIIHKNYWMMWEDKPFLNKWYFNEYDRGGIIHWFKPEEEYSFHKWYKLPDSELRDLLEEALRWEALDSFLYTDEDFNAAYKKYTEHYGSFENMVDQEIEKYYKGYEIDG